MIPQVRRLAAYALATDAERVLLVRQSEATPVAGRWGLPGGGVEHGEDPRAALVRELDEETGLPGAVGEILEVHSGHPGRIRDDRPASARHAAGHRGSPTEMDYQWVALVFAATVPTDRAPRVTEVDGSASEAAWLPVSQALAAPLVRTARQALTAFVQGLPVYHLALAADWARAEEQGSYDVSTRGRTLADEGFIHASWEHQVGATRRRFYSDAGPLVRLRLDTAALRQVGSHVRVDIVADAGQAFPHVYGPIPVSAVEDVAVLAD
ncbi:MAG: DUF952 domain-containing protein [Actinomycetales bacterium]